VAHGVYTGKTVGTLTYREGKITRLLEWLDAEEETLEGASFYSDSRNDLPLLLKVDFPHVVNPDPLLSTPKSRLADPSLEMTTTYGGACPRFRRRGASVKPRHRSSRASHAPQDQPAFVNHQHHLPSTLLLASSGKRRFGILDRKSPGQLWTQASFSKQRPHMLAQIAEQIGLELIIATAQGRSQQLHAFDST
jgi:hypothetical protein